MLFFGHNTNMSIFNSNQNSVPFHPEHTPKYYGELSSKTVEGLFSDCGDFQLRKISAGLIPHNELCVCWIDGVTDGGSVAEEILRPLTDILRNGMELSPERLLSGAIYSAQAQEADDLDGLVSAVCSGSCAVIFDSLKKAVCFEVRTKNQRNISEPKIEKSLKGGKDCFVELLRTNTSLVRRRICDPMLKLKTVVLGRKSQTRAAIMYLDGVCDPKLVCELENRLNAIDIDGVLSTGCIEEYIVDRPKSLFPQILHTERPDRFSRQLLNGRVGLIVDGIPLAFMLPASFPEFMRVPQDESQNYIVSGMLSIIRWAAILLALALPAFYVSVSMYHQEMIPTKLLQSIITSKQSVPFSTAVEVVGMLLAFELLQEAGLRLPDPVSDTVSIIGALIVGQSAVEAKVISPIAVIVVATAGIAGYAQPSQDLSAALRICRLVLLLLGIAAGLYGVSVGLCILTWYLCTIDSFGLSYTAPLSGGGVNALMGTFLRKPLPSDKLRDPELDTPDKRRQK